MRISERLQKLHERLVDLRQATEDLIDQEQVAEFNSIDDEMWDIIYDLEGIGEQL